MARSAEEQASFRERSERFAVFLKYTDQKTVQRETTTKDLQENFPDVWHRVQDRNYPFVAYYMGAGNGGLEIPLTLDLIEARGIKTNIELICEDPSVQMKEQFFTAAQKTGVAELVKDYNTLPFEDPFYQPPDADLSLSSHVWYYVKGWKGVVEADNTLTKFTNSVKKRKGVGLITLHSRTSDRYALLSQFLTSTGEKREVAGEDLTTELDRLGIKYKSNVVEAHTDISTCFQDGVFNPSEKGKLLLSFLLRADWDELPENIRQQAQEGLTLMVQRNGEEVMKFNDLYIWVKSTW